MYWINYFTLFTIPYVQLEVEISARKRQILLFPCDEVCRVNSLSIDIVVKEKTYKTPVYS